MTAQQLINSSLRLIGVLATGESPTTTESDDALVVLNHIIGQLSNEQDIAYTIHHNTFTLTSGAFNYTLGVNGSWTTSARPFKVTGAHAVNGNFSKGLEVLPMGEYRRRIGSDIGITAVLPMLLGADTSYPALNIEVWPTPNTTGSSVRLDYWQPISTVASLSTDLAFPEGYEKLLRFELALDLATEYGRPVTETLLAGAVGARNSIKSMRNIIPAVEAEEQPAAE
jgi:hypothetical protein